MSAQLLSILLEELMAEGAFEVVVFDFVEAVHVELADEAVHFVVPEVFGQDEFFHPGWVFDDELQAARGPVDYLLVLFVLHRRGVTETISKALKTNPATSLSSCCFAMLRLVELSKG